GGGGGQALDTPIHYDPLRLGSHAFWTNGAAGRWRSHRLEVPECLPSLAVLVCCATRAGARNERAAMAHRKRSRDGRDTDRRDRLEGRTLAGGRPCSPTCAAQQGPNVLSSSSRAVERNR